MRRVSARRAGMVAVGWTAACTAQAHVPLDLPTAVAPPWTFEPWVMACLALSLLLYARGLVRLWHKAGGPRGVRWPQALAFAGGWLALAAALMSPLDALGHLLFSAHMVQHEVLMVVAAPLLVLGRPLAVWAWALSPALRRRVGRGVSHPAVARPWRVLSDATVAWALHGVVLWAWHLPALFEAALASGTIHTLQHLSFFGTALLFWWAPLAGASRSGQGASMFYLFSTMVHTAVLGALLTLAPTLWYPSYGPTAAALGFDPLEDQQLGGLVMWVPAGLAYLAAGLAVAARALRPRSVAAWR